MGINYFICLVTIFAFHQILDTGGLLFNFTVPAVGIDEIDDHSSSGGGGGGGDNNRIGDGSNNEIDIRREEEEEEGERRFLNVISETRDHVKLRLNEVYFCNDTIYTCLINVHCRDATIEEKDYLLGVFQSIHEDETYNNNDDDDQHANIE